MKYIIGIDIGGTKISLALGSTTGKILEKRILRTKIGGKFRESIREIENSVCHLMKSRRLKSKVLLGIGIGVPGPVDPEKERIENSPNLKGWKGVPLRSILKRRFGRPVFLENDANAAALGEKYFGEGRSVADFVYITVSTGIGSGIVANGKLVRGSQGAAGEFGHTTIQVNGKKCSCGKKGCLEAYASGTAIAKSAIQILRKGRKSIILKFCSGIKKINAEVVSRAAKAGDRLAIEIKREAADYLGVGLGNLINLFNSKRIILGGGVLQEPDHFWKPMMRAVRREAWPIALRSCKIVRTKLGNRVGDLGAMAVVLERLKI